MKVLLAADDAGALKEVICKRGTDTSVQKATQPDSITNICQETRQTAIQKFMVYKEFIVTARLKGAVCFYEKDGEHKEVLRFEKCSSGPDDRFVALLESFGLIFTCTESGIVTIIDPENLKSKALSVPLKGPVSAFISHPLQKGIFAYGGKENDVKIVMLFDQNVKDKDLESNLKPEILFQGKNVKNDKLDLRVPIWISGILFTEAAVKRGSWKLITVTRYGQIRKYDTAHGRKPISDVKVSEKPLLTLTLTLEPNEIICSDTHTTTAKFDIEKGILLGKYKGAVGSIQALHAFLEGNLIVTGGLDRYFRAFDIDSREQVAKVYVGTQISDILMLEDDEVEVDEEDPETKALNKRRLAELDDEQLWDKLESNTKAKLKKSKK